MLLFIDSSPCTCYMTKRQKDKIVLHIHTNTHTRVYVCIFACMYVCINIKFRTLSSRSIYLISQLPFSSRENLPEGTDAQSSQKYAIPCSNTFFLNVCISNQSPSPTFTCPEGLTFVHSLHNQRRPVKTTYYHLCTGPSSE